MDHFFILTTMGGGTTIYLGTTQSW